MDVHQHREMSRKYTLNNLPSQGQGVPSNTHHVLRLKPSYHGPKRGEPHHPTTIDGNGEATEWNS